jgi:hypothetical protein
MSEAGSNNVAADAKEPRGLDLVTMAKVICGANYGVVNQTMELGWFRHK